MNKVQLFLIADHHGLKVTEDKDGLAIHTPDQILELPENRTHVLGWLFKVSYEFLTCISPSTLEALIGEYQSRKTL